MKKTIIIFLIMLICLTTLLTGCNVFKQGKQFVSYSYFDTVTTLALYGFFYDGEMNEKAEKLWAEVKIYLENLDKSVSINRSESDVSRFNTAESGDIEINDYTYEVFKNAQYVYNLSKGAYNPAMGIYIDLWGFSPRFRNEDYVPTKAYDRENYTEKLPDEKYVNGFKSLVDFDKIIIKEVDGKKYLVKPDISVEIDGIKYTMQLDFGGIVKGYAADTIENLIKISGFDYGYISMGGSSLRVLKNTKKIANAVENDWEIGIVDPSNTNSKYIAIYAQDKAISTSGSYENFFALNDRTYSHIIDNDTFEPIETNVCSVSVIGLTACESDAITTALCSMTPAEIIAFTDNYLGDVIVSFVYLNGKNYEIYSNVTDEKYIVKNENFTFKGWTI